MSAEAKPLVEEAFEQTDRSLARTREAHALRKAQQAAREALAQCDRLAAENKKLQEALEGMIAEYVDFLLAERDTTPTERGKA